MANYKNVSDKQLLERINNLRAECERTADCLKELEAELKRRAEGMPLGIPLTSSATGRVLSTYYFYFTSDKSKKVFDERLKEYFEALQKLAKGEPIDIEVLLPLLKKGWVAMDKNDTWHWYKEKPYIEKNYFCWNTGHQFSFIGGFNIKPAKYWSESLMECGL